MQTRLIYQFLGILFSLALTSCCACPTPKYYPQEPSTTPKATVTIPTTQTPFIIFTPMPSKTANTTQIAFETEQAPTIQAEKTLVSLTQEVAAKLRPEILATCYYDYNLVSPNNKWTAYDCMDELRFLSSDKQKHIIMSHKKLSLPKMDVYHVDLYTWSKDSRYIYFWTSFAYDNLNLGRPLYQLDIELSKWTIVDEGLGSTYLLSQPGQRWMVHIPDGGMPIQFHIFNLETNTEEWLQLQNFEQPSQATLNPTGTHFAITAQNGENGQYAVFVVSLNDLSITQVAVFNHKPSILWNEQELIIDECFNDRSTLVCKRFVYNIE